MCKSIECRVLAPGSLGPGPDRPRPPGTRLSRFAIFSIAFHVAFEILCVFNIQYSPLLCILKNGVVRNWAPNALELDPLSHEQTKLK